MRNNGTCRFFFLYFLFIVLSAAGASDLQFGIRGFISGGYPSGKGLWDWTDPAQEGTPEWDWGSGASLLMGIPLRNTLFLVNEATCAYIRGGQSLDDRHILYEQSSLEYSALLRARLPFEGKGILLAGGLGLIFPLDARMDGVGSRPEKPVMLCLKAGMDFLTFRSKGSEWYLSGYFTHAVTSPGYRWVEGSSGSVRINRADLALTWLFPREE